MRVVTTRPTGRGWDKCYPRPNCIKLRRSSGFIRRDRWILVAPPTTYIP